MEVYTGRSVRPGVAIAAAARLKTEYGVPGLDPQRLRRIGERLRRFGVEVPDREQVILVGDTIPSGFLLASLPGLEFVGMAAEVVTGDLSSLGVPTVTGLPDTLLASLAEEEIIILDGDRGRVYVGPDAMTLARYQTPFRRARRIFLDGAHLPARTASDDRPVGVLAEVTALAAVDAAIAEGADGILVATDNDFLGPEDTFQSASDQAEVLRALTDRLGGKPLFLAVPSERLALSALARAAASGPIHLLLEEVGLRDELGDRMHEIEAVLEEQDVPFGSVRFEAFLATTSEATTPDDLSPYAGVCIVEDLRSADMGRLLLVAGQAQHAARPLTLRLPAGEWQTALAEALEFSAARLIAPVTAVADVKDGIRAS